MASFLLLDPPILNDYCLKATVENPGGSVEKLSSKESVEYAHTVLRGSARAPEGFSKGKPEAEKTEGAQPPRFCSQGESCFPSSEV